MRVLFIYIYIYIYIMPAVILGTITFHFLSFIQFLPVCIFFSPHSRMRSVGERYRLQQFLQQPVFMHC